MKGVNRVTVSPGEKAAARADAYIEGVQRNQDKWKQRVSSVSLEDWKRSAADKGAGRISAGVNAAESKQVQFAQQLLAAVDSAKAELESIPRGDLATNLERARIFATRMSEFRRT